MIAHISKTWQHTRVFKHFWQHTVCTTPHQHNQNNPRRCGDVDIHDTNPQHFSCSHTTHNVQHNPPRVRTCCFFKHIWQTGGVVPVIVSHAGGCVPVGVLCFFLQFTTQHTVSAHIVCGFLYNTQHNTPGVHTLFVTHLAKQKCRAGGWLTSTVCEKQWFVCPSGLYAWQERIFEDSLTFEQGPGDGKWIMDTSTHFDPLCHWRKHKVKSRGRKMRSPQTEITQLNIDQVGKRHADNLETRTNKNGEA